MSVFYISGSKDSSYDSAAEHVDDEDLLASPYKRNKKSIPVSAKSKAKSGTAGKSKSTSQKGKHMAAPLKGKSKTPLEMKTKPVAPTGKRKAAP
jgi:hypothetical protein